MNALVVEDDPGVRQLMKQVMEPMGFAVSEVESVQDALDHIYDADLLILDILLPSSSGRTVLAKLRGSRDDIPVIVVSGFPDTKKDILQTPLTYWVDKPFHVGRFMDTLETARSTANSMKSVKESSRNLGSFIERARQALK